MSAISINVSLGQGMTRVQIMGKRPSEWRKPDVPEFFVEFESAGGRELMVVQREQGHWYDQVPLVAKTATYYDYLMEGWDDWFNPDYKSPLTDDELQLIGALINDYIVQMSHFALYYLAA